MTLLAWRRRRGLDTFALQRAADLYGAGEISSGKFREFAMLWAAGEDISADVKHLEDGGR